MSLVDKITPGVFIEACKESSHGIYRFLGAEFEKSGDARKAIKAVGKYVCAAIWTKVQEASK